VILDLTMPVMDGMEAARQIREIAPNAYILLFTMHTIPQLALAAREVGIDAVISKSDFAKLMSTIRTRLAA
jgi:DNA-binding NarL/FixJ family response regulator